MNPEIKAALRGKLLAMADDDLLLGHRNSEWTGHAPILEEDIAFANIALDEIGHAKLWYEILADLEGEDRETYPDRLVFHRLTSAWRSAQITELDKGDFAFTIVRQYLCDTAELARLEGLRTSSYTPVAEVANKIIAEEHYHHRHTRAWVRRLGLGTEESHERMERALHNLWPFTAQLFAPVPDEALLVEAGIVPDPQAVKEAWEGPVRAWLAECNLPAPEGLPPVNIGREIHTEHLVTLLGEMQSVARLVPEGVW